MNAEQAVAQALAGVGSPALAYGTSVRDGNVRKQSDNQSIPKAVPHRCVFVQETQGITGVPYVDGGNKTGERFVGLQVWIRGDPNVYEATKLLANAVFDALDMSPPAGAFEMRAQGSGPAYVRKDELDRHNFTINLILKRQV